MQTTADTELLPSTRSVTALVGSPIDAKDEETAATKAKIAAKLEHDPTCTVLAMKEVVGPLRTATLARLMREVKGDMRAHAATASRSESADLTAMPVPVDHALKALSLAVLTHIARIRHEEQDAYAVRSAREGQRADEELRSTRTEVEAATHSVQEMAQVVDERDDQLTLLRDESRRLHDRVRDQETQLVLAQSQANEHVRHLVTLTEEKDQLLSRLDKESARATRLDLEVAASHQEMRRMEDRVMRADTETAALRAARDQSTERCAAAERANIELMTAYAAQIAAVTAALVPVRATSASRAGRAVRTVKQVVSNTTQK